MLGKKEKEPKGHFFFTRLFLFYFLKGVTKVLAGPKKTMTSSIREKQGKRHSKDTQKLYKMILKRGGHPEPFKPKQATSRKTGLGETSAL